MIEEDFHIEQPQGFEFEDIVTHVCKLKKCYVWTEAKS